jgi:hypothetical protein
MTRFDSVPNEPYAYTTKHPKSIFPLCLDYRLLFVLHYVCLHLANVVKSKLSTESIISV